MTLHYLNTTLTGLFTLECVMKIFSFGFRVNATTPFRVFFFFVLGTDSTKIDDTKIQKLGERLFVKFGTSQIDASLS